MNSLFYVGMDVHKETISLAVIRDNSRTIEFERQIRNEPGGIKKYFTKLKDRSANIICCYEAGPTRSDEAVRDYLRMCNDMRRYAERSKKTETANDAVLASIRKEVSYQ